MAQILVIDDNPDNLELMSYLLRMSGHQAVRAVDGYEGIEVASRQPFDLIICDAHLPGMDGATVVRRLKENPVLAGIPVVVATASKSTSDKEEMMSPGFDDYIEKPIIPNEFLSQIEHILSLKSKS